MAIIIRMCERAMGNRMWRRALRMRKDTSGIAAVEFAMILPLALAMLFGILDISNGFAVDRKVSQIAQSMSDLTSRYTTVADTDINNFFIIADAMLTPYDKTKLKATISQVYLDPSSKTAKVVWSRGDNKANRAPGKVIPVPTSLIQKDSSGAFLPNQYLILSEITYDYTPTIGWVMPKSVVTLSESSYMRPRQTACVTLPTSCAPTGG
jgi:Flp pilus assembly protein TadG